MAKLDLVPNASESLHGFDYFGFKLALESRLAEWRAMAPELAARYSSAHPFPHIVMDDFLPNDVLEAIHADFPEKSSTQWTKLPTEDQREKYVIGDETRLPPKIRLLIQELNSGGFLGFLEKLTGIDDLVADTKLKGGGLHMIGRGGKLSVHVDFSHHPTNGLCRRLNLLIYLNKDWKEEYGGHFELWSKDIKSREASILPIYNRCVVFTTSPISYHGHPEPLTCPEERQRKSIALYYFTKGRGTEAEVEHNTLFKSRPGDSFNLGNFLVRSASSGLFRDLIPPLVYRAIRRVWNRSTNGDTGG